MLVATPGQTTTYSTLHSNGGSNNTNGSAHNKTATTLNSTNGTAPSTPKLLKNNNNHTTPSTSISKNLLNSNVHATTYNYHQQISRSEKNVSNKHSSNGVNSNNKSILSSSTREINTSIITSATTATTAHSFKNNNTTKQSFIQTLKDSVQKALISTTGSIVSSSINNKPNNNSNNCNNPATSIHNVTSSSSSASYNANKVSTTSLTTSSNSTTTSQSSSSMSLVRNKYFSCSLSKLYTIAPTIIHRYPEERQHASSTDSLQKEMCHFKPIRIAPTTPWKSGSRFRGNSLRFPKAYLATEKSDCILKSNCDVNNKKKKYEQIRSQDNKANENDDDNNEQENNEYYGIYKPKPSLTCLSTSVNTPNHQSAFVCLVTKMKNFENIQPKKLTSLTKSAKVIAEETTGNMIGTKTKNTRAVRTTVLTTTTRISNTPTDKTTKEYFAKRKQKSAKKLVQVREVEAVKELPQTRSTRLASNATKNKSLSTTTATSLNKARENIKRTNAKITELPKLSAVATTDAKSRRKPGRAKSRINNIALGNTKVKGKLENSKSNAVSVTATIVNNKPTKTRKRKHTHEDEAEATPSPLSPLPRKNSRLSNSKQPAAVNRKQTATSFSNKPRKNPTTSISCFSPPLTRSRLKHLKAGGRIISTATEKIKKRRI